ncbi:AAA family ATPase [candidate division KSB1 bacterium]|nr:AAA family ATPase [candidate division KSB1 bacterium]
MKNIELEQIASAVSLPKAVENYLLDTNLWWQNIAMPQLPSLRRWLFEPALQRLKDGLAPILALRGPRQVGKTTLKEHLIHHLLYAEKIDPKRIFQVQFDAIPSLKGVADPILSLCRWFEHRILGARFNEYANKGEPVYIFFDEAQNLPDWSPQLKALVDHHRVRVLLTGSSALRIEAGRDSLAGRITTLDMGTLLLREIAELRGWGEIPALLPFNGIKHLKEKEFWESLREHGHKYRELRDRAFAAFSERGGYPIAQVRADRPWEEIADQLNETVIRRVIHHDLRKSTHGRKRDPSLLEEIFRISCRYIGEEAGPSAFIPDLRWALGTDYTWQQVLTYRNLLDDALLIRLVEPLEIRRKKQKGYAKICLCDHALRASWLQEVIPLTPEDLQRSPHLSDLAGRIAESIIGYYLHSIPSLDIAWHPHRSSVEPEVDFILTVGEHRIPLEVKYRQQIDWLRDTKGMRFFLEKAVYNAPFGILVTLTDDVTVLDPRIVTLPLSSLLLMR